ncbi:hypothetical protein RYH80_03870 [Halobaculum sp. MBLA0147]|uniref:hypothetical protein n=1 Tax=Halobaculum sp. MBLA0147 TaxID=3079934 RepID=UPI003524585E
MREDDLATPVVTHLEAANDTVTVALEEPYDHYGNRGQVDVYARVRDPPRTDYLVELKADAAVRRATGTNEILRQFRRMERYFYRGDDHGLRRRLGRTEPGVHLLLLFAPTATCVDHVAAHADLYETLDPETTVEGVDARRTVAFPVGLDNPATLRLCSVNGRAGIDTEPFHAAVPDDSRLADALAEAGVGVEGDADPDVSASGDR